MTLLDCGRSEQYLLRDWSSAMIPLGGPTPNVESMVEKIRGTLAGGEKSSRIKI
jgi:hypothetical protein